MAYNFPDNPTDGQQTPDGNWIYDGTLGVWKPVAGSAADYVLKAGDTMVGPLEVPAGATGNQVPRQGEVVPLAGGVTMTGLLTLSGAPTAPNHAATKLYADTLPFLSSDPTGVTGAAAITNIISLAQADYDAIGTKDPTTLYLIDA
jgi:hypothetical protein